MTSTPSTTSAAVPQPRAGDHASAAATAFRLESRVGAALVPPGKLAMLGSAVGAAAGEQLRQAAERMAGLGAAAQGATAALAELPVSPPIAQPLTLWGPEGPRRYRAVAKAGTPGYWLLPLEDAP
jgi:hypothetical protein